MLKPNQDEQNKLLWTEFNTKYCKQQQTSSPLQLPLHGHSLESKETGTIINLILNKAARCGSDFFPQLLQMQSEKGENPLTYVGLHGTYKEVATLAKIFKKNTTPLLFQELISSRNNIGNTILHNAAINPQQSVLMIKLLIKLGIDINDKNDSGNTPLHYALEHKHLVIVLHLLHFNAKIDLANNDGKTALDFALHNSVLDKNYTHIAKAIITKNPYVIAWNDCSKSITNSSIPDQNKLQMLHFLFTEIIKSNNQFLSIQIKNTKCKTSSKLGALDVIPEESNELLGELEEAIS